MYHLKGLFISLFFLLACNSLNAQNQANIWYFGYNGETGLDFNNNPPTILRNGKISTAEGTAVMADSSGNLLFYTDGITVYDRNHNIIETGLFGHESSTQSALIVPHPGNENLYLIFTTDVSEWGEKTNRGLNYSVLDMRLNNGMGGIVLKNKNLFLNSTEKLTAVQGIDCKQQIWVISHPYGTDEYYTYLVDRNGLNPKPVISKVGLSHSSVNTPYLAVSQGQLVVSSNGKFLACAVQGGNNGGWLELYDFDYTTGKIYNPRLLSDLIPESSYESYKGFYGVAFSPDNTKLYAAHRLLPLFQFDLLNLEAEPVQIATENVYRLQLAPDGKIYGTLSFHSDGLVIPEDQGKYLCVINKPNERGKACEYIEKAIFMGENAIISTSLPNFIQSYFYRGNDVSGVDFTASDLCAGSDTQFKASSKANISHWEWDFGDPASGSLNTSTQQNPAHAYQKAGIYNVRVMAMNECGVTDTIRNEITIYDDPVIDLGQDSLSVCFDDVPVKLKAEAYSNTDYQWSSGISSRDVEMDKTGWYKVTATNACHSRSDSVYLHVIPKATAYIPNDTIVCDGNFALLDAQNPGAKYLWNTGEVTQAISVNTPGKYWVTIENECSSVTDSTNLILIKEDLGHYTTNVFTPNGDGINESFVNYIINTPDFYLKIVNRWGKLMFETKDPFEYWDGKHHGEEVSAGVYYYVIHTVDCHNKPLKLMGTVSILR
jgi:gliding motility-associated-like protein